MMSSATPVLQPPLPKAARHICDARIKVLVVDDSKAVSTLVSRWLASQADVEVVGVATNGLEAIELALRHKPDITLLDINMPVMDGLAALPEILKASPLGRVIVAAASTQRGKHVTIQALSKGACDYLAKPDAHDVECLDYRDALIAKIRLLGARHQICGESPCQACLAVPTQSAATVECVPERQKPLFERPRAIFIGASTGGPEALGVVLGALAGKIQVPILIAQHMPAGFTAALVEQLNKLTHGRTKEAQEDMACEAGHFYVAPGDKQMSVFLNSDTLRIAIKPSPQFARPWPETSKPAIDPLFHSAAKALGGASLAIMLTGMGEDGREGAKAMVSKGSLLIAQDAATSVAWGMPGAVVKAGIATTQVPLHDIAPTVLALMQGEFQ